MVKRAGRGRGKEDKTLPLVIGEGPYFEPARGLLGGTWGVKLRGYGGLCSGCSRSYRPTLASRVVRLSRSSRASSGHLLVKVSLSSRWAIWTLSFRFGLSLSVYLGILGIHADDSVVKFIADSPYFTTEVFI